MKNSWFSNVVWSSILLIMLSACSKHTYKHAAVAGGFEGAMQSPFFEQDSIHYFKTSIDTYGKALSGILAVKKQSGDTLKVSFFTEMGVSFFDAYVTHDSYQLIRCISQLDSKPVMNTIIEDIRWVVLFNKNQLSDPVQIKSASNQQTVRFNYQGAYIFAELAKDNYPYNITYVYGSKYKRKFEVKYATLENLTASQIFVEHFNFDLKIQLIALSFTQ
jgi:hypothetical protein